VFFLSKMNEGVGACLLFHLKNSGFWELSHVSETHQLCTSEMLIDETACEDTRIEAARALATGEGKGEEYVSRTIRFVRQGSGHKARQNYLNLSH
jgi:hypothetical protein